MADDQTTRPGTTDTVETEETQETVLEQEVSIEDIGPARKLLTIEIPESRIKSAREEMFGKLRTDANVPGFRQGRAPQRLLEKRFGSAVREDVKNQILAESYQQVIDKNDIRVIGEPDVKDLETLELPDSGALTVKIEIEVTPEVKLPSLEGIEVEKVAVSVSDEAVDKEIRQFCDRLGSFEDTTDPIEPDDYVQAHVIIHPAGKADEILREEDAYIFVPGESREFKGHILGIVVPELGKQLLGKRVDDELELTLTGPESHENDAIKGKPITIKLKLLRNERIKPAETKDVATQFGFDTDDELKDYVRTTLTTRQERVQNASMHEQLVKHLVEKSELALPEGLTGRQIERVLSRKKMEMSYVGKNEEEIEQALAEMRTQTEEEAIEQLKQFFVIDAAAESLSIEVDEPTLNGRIVMMAREQGRRPEKMRQEMARSGELENLYLQIREQKTLDAILEKAKVKEITEAQAAEKDQQEKTKSEKKSGKKSEAKAEKKADAKDEGDATRTPKKKSSKKKSSKKKTDDA